MSGGCDTSVLTQKQIVLFAQKECATKPDLLGCTIVEGLKEDFGDIEQILCRDPYNGNEFKAVGIKRSAPGMVEATISSMIYCSVKNYLENINCPFRLYIMVMDCGRTDQFSNWKRAWVLDSVHLINRDWGDLGSFEEDNEIMVKMDIKAPWPLHTYYSFTEKNVSPVDQPFSSVVVCESNGTCSGSGCGCTSKEACGKVFAVSRPSTAIYMSTDGGENFVETGAQPSSFGASPASLICLPDGGLLATSFGDDPNTFITYDDAETWIEVGTGVHVDPTISSSGAFPWNGNMYFGGNGGIISQLNFDTFEINIVENLLLSTPVIGFACKDSTLYAYSADGSVAYTSNGTTWTLGTSVNPVGSVRSVGYSCCGKVFVGDSEGYLYQSEDFVNYTSRKVSSGVIFDISFFDSHLMALGSIDTLVSIDGGYFFKKISNNDARSVAWCNENTLFTAGSTGINKLSC